jgi:integrase
MGSLIKQQVVAYVDADGRRVPKGTPGSRKVRTKSRKWYGQYTDADGQRRRVPLCTDKAAARQLLAALERDTDRGRAGLTDRRAAHGARPLDEHLADYEASLRNRGVSAKHLTETMRRLRAVVAGCGARAVGDLAPEAVERFLAGLAAKGTGPRTRNTYLTSSKAFLNWCADQGRAGRDVLRPVRSAPEEPRRRRRALGAAELVRLLEAARARPLQEALTVRKGPRRGERYAAVRDGVRRRLERLGRERALIYKAAVLTGLRRGELAALRVHHLDLSGRALRLPGEFTKNGKDAELPLRDDLAADLEAWLADAGKRASDPVFDVPDRMNKILRRDLAWAGIPYKDERGRVFDFHALRHTTASHLGRAKVAPRVAQGIMRHSHIKLTMQTYADPELMDRAEAMTALPALPLPRGSKADDRG